MIPENEIYTSRDVRTETIEFKGYEIEVTIKPLTNRESDMLFDKYTTFDELTKDVQTDAASLYAERLQMCLIDTNLTFKDKAWTELSEEEKTEALDTINPKIRELINEKITEKNHLTEGDMGFTQKP